MCCRNIYQWESQFLILRLWKVSFWDRDWDFQKSVSVLRLRLRLENSWCSRLRPRIRYEQFSRPRPLKTCPWMSRLRLRPRVSLISVFLDSLWWMRMDERYPLEAEESCAIKPLLFWKKLLLKIIMMIYDWLLDFGRPIGSQSLVILLMNPALIHHPLTSTMALMHLRKLYVLMQLISTVMHPLAYL